jgi:hypothetical protein
MVEALWVIGVVALLVALGVMAVVLPLPVLLGVGAACMAAGLVFGVPAGAYYHVKLYRCLAAKGGVPSGFLWHPTRYHAALLPEERRGVMPWFMLGGAGFALIMLGCMIFMLGFLRV